MKDRREQDDSQHDCGLGLIEVVVSMFVVALLAIALLPVLMQGLRQSAQNETLASAAQLAEDQLVKARSQANSCLAVKALDTTTAPVPDVVTPSGVTLAVTVTVGECPTADYGTVDVAVAVVNADTGASLTGAKTLVYVEK